MSGGKGFSNELRLAWIGVQGEWGTIALGRQNNPFTESLNAGTEADEFNGNYTSALRIATGEVVFGGAMPTRVGNSIAYVSPSFSGFNFVVAGITEVPNAEAFAKTNPGVSPYYAPGNKSKGFDIYTATLNYEHESGFFAKAAYLGADMQKDVKRANAYGLNVGFANEQWGVNADFAGASRGKSVANDVKTTSTGWDLGGHFSFGPDYFSTVRATVGQSEVKEKAAFTTKNKVTVWAVGFEQKLSTRTKVWVEYAKENDKVKVNGISGSDKTNRDAFSVGIRHDF
jgi:predicted porin